MFLTTEELTELTHKERPSAQIRTHADLRTTQKVYQRKPEIVRPLK